MCERSVTDPDFVGPFESIGIGVPRQYQRPWQDTSTPPYRRREEPGPHTAGLFPSTEQPCDQADDVGGTATAVIVMSNTPTPGSSKLAVQVISEPSPFFLPKVLVPSGSA